MHAISLSSGKGNMDILHLNTHALHVPKLECMLLENLEVLEPFLRLPFPPDSVREGEKQAETKRDRETTILKHFVIC